MDNYNIILFLCNWGPHTAYQRLQEKNYNIPPEVKMVRIPCTGRISKALLFKAFEMGADGVALVGCNPGSCRYGSGTESAIKNSEDTRDILDLLNVGKERMRLENFLPDEYDKLGNFLESFTTDIKKMGKSPILSSKNGNNKNPESVNEIISNYDGYACQDCGKCTSSCPLALTGKEYSPRALVNSLISGNIDSEKVKKDIWSCLTCGICFERCPSNVNFPELICELRNYISQNDDDKLHQTHGGFFQSLMRSMTSPDLKPDKWKHLSSEIKTDPESKTLFFGGCAPYFDVFFRSHQKVKTTAIVENSLRLLNFFDITPRILDNERCCGHDLLWSGDRDNFLELAKLNVEYFNKLGIEELITSCPECYRSFKTDYPANGIKPDFEIKYIYELLEDKIDKSAVTFSKYDKNLTYQDSCRLKNANGLKSLPEKLLKRMNINHSNGKKDNNSATLCCGNSAWTGCDSFSKSMQVKRIRQAQSTGSEVLVTSCPKCQIHLKCAMQDPFLGDELGMEMIDLTTILAKTICWE